MNKADFIHEVSEKLDGTIPQATIKAVLDATGDVLFAELQTGAKVSILGLGKLEPVERKERKGHNPRTGEVITIPSKKAVKFTAGKALKDALN